MVLPLHLAHILLREPGVEDRLNAESACIQIRCPSAKTCHVKSGDTQDQDSGDISYYQDKRMSTRKLFSDGLNEGEK